MDGSGAVVFVMATALVAVWSLARRTRSAAAPTDPRVMLAVLPFQNLSGAADQDYFSDGLTEETISNLGRLSPEDLGVIARTSAMTFKHTTKTVREIGRELGVDYILEGSVRRDGGTVRVSAQLIRVADQTHLWAHSYDRPLRDLLALEGELGRDIAGQVQLKLTPRQKATLKRTTSIDPRAYEAYLKARHFWFQFRLDSLNRSIDYYNEALQWDGKYAAAYAGLAAAYSVRANLYTPPTEDYPKAKAAADKALQLDQGLPNAHRAMAAIHIFYDWDWPAANRELTRLWELDPNPTTHLLEAYYLEAMGRSGEAVALLKKFANWIRSHHSSETIWGGRTTAAAEYTKARDLAPLAGLNARRGDIVGATALRKELERQARQEYVDPLAFTILCIGIGDKEAAAGWLEQAYENRSAGLIWLNADQVYEPLRSDARFQNVRRAVGLPE
jgi:TolB-like protein